METPRPNDLCSRIAAIVARGLLCRLHLATNEWGWSCLEVQPLEGFTHLCEPEVLAKFEADGWRYHVTLGYWVPEELLAEVSRRWDGVSTVLEVDYISEWTCVARLAARGVGGCPAVLAAIAAGNDEDRARFGPHVSM